MPDVILRIGVIEDNEVFSQELLQSFSGKEDIICVLNTTSTKEFLVSLKPFHQIDLLLLDIHLPGESGIKSLPKLRKSLPLTTIVMFTVEEDHDMLFKAFSMGADGYLIKDNNWEALYKNLKIAQEGGAIISPGMAKALIGYFKPPQKPKGLKQLGEKDFQVLHLLAQGWSYQYIGKQLDMTIDNVRYYIRKLYKRLEVNSRHEATRKLFDNPDILKNI